MAEKIINDCLFLIIRAAAFTMLIENTVSRKLKRS